MISLLIDMKPLYIVRVRNMAEKISFYFCGVIDCESGFGD
jgi:hypothetical protein